MSARAMLEHANAERLVAITFWLVPGLILLGLLTN